MDSVVDDPIDLKSIQMMMNNSKKLMIIQKDANPEDGEQWVRFSG